MKLADWLKAAADRLVDRPKETDGGSRFLDLAPTDEADPAGAYSAALTTATDSPRVMNIALTGPYGSGKSSIIKSFLKGYRRPVLQISLAAFLPEAVATGGQVGRQEIERSILQQMLYGADANRLPLSRFKRIQSPGRWSLFASLFMVLGLIACWHLIQKRAAIVTGVFFHPFSLTNWFNLLAFAIGGGFLWLVFHHVYVASFGISLKSISLKDIEITPKAVTEESILNRHLDEIIYFFQSTKYDLVVIEDLDRFNNADIFVTLREINSLVNANSGVKRRIRFLYALRDDMFANTDRTKFFEFIVPVIPIINSSNSIDKVLEQVKRLSLDDKLDQQFLREVSRHLNDLRLIRNIFNEYAIYVANLETEDETNLDANKLLAVLIYKNVFPSDFENLHREKGNLAQVLRGRDQYVAESEARSTAEISRLQHLIDLGEGQLPNDLTDLRRIYAMALIETVPEGYNRISLDRSASVPLNALANDEQIESVLASRQIFATTGNGNRHNLSISDLQARVNPHQTYQQRKDEVEAKSASFRDMTNKRIHDLRARLGTLRMSKFNEVIRESAEDLDDLFDGFGDDADLARFLILEGHLDDTYYQYTSLFHSGRLSPSDNKYLIRIRGFRNPAPDFQIDNPKEVIVAMRAEDFSRDYALNVRIVDCLLSDASMYATQTGRLLEFIASDFEGSEAFLATYYSRGVAVPMLITGLARTWRGFVTAAVDSPAGLTHVARILSHLPDEHLKDLAKRHRTLSAFVSKRLPDILALGIDFPPERLRMLNVEVTDLSAVEAHPGFMRFLVDEGFYELSIVNLNFVFRAVLGIADDTGPRERNYTLVLEAGNAPLLSKVDGRFGEYLENVLLRLPDNRFESVEANRRVLLRTDVEFESVVRYLEKQTVQLPTLDQVPADYHVVLFELGRIEPTWENCLSLIGSESYDAKVLTDFLDRDTTVAALARHMVPDGDSAAPLREFIVENDALSDEAYAAYVRALPRRSDAFPKHLGPGKTRALVDQNRVAFSAANLARLSDDLPLGVMFVERNIDAFFEIEEDCDLDDDFREKLLRADLGDENRLRILRSMDLSLLEDMPSRAAIVGGILARTELGSVDLEVDAARAIVLNSRPLDAQISLFNMLHEKFDERQVREILQRLPDPFPDIGPGRVTPRIKGSEVNRRLSAWLKARGLISSWKQGGAFDDDIRLNLFRK